MCRIKIQNAMDVQKDMHCIACGNEVSKRLDKPRSTLTLRKATAINIAPINAVRTVDKQWATHFKQLLKNVSELPRKRANQSHSPKNVTRIRLANEMK